MKAKFTMVYSFSQNYLLTDADWLGNTPFVFFFRKNTEWNCEQLCLMVGLNLILKIKWNMRSLWIYGFGGNTFLGRSLAP